MVDDEGEPAVAEELGGADGGEADQGEEGHGAAQEGEEQVCQGRREPLSDVIGDGICNVSCVP